MKAAVIGSGGWGSAVAVLLARKYDVCLWSWQREESDRLNRDRENKDFLPGIIFPDNIVCSHDMRECIEGAEITVTAPPSPAARTTAKQMSRYVKEGGVIVNISKGIEEGSLKRLSRVYAEEIPQAKIAVMSGPSHAEEVSRGVPTTNVAAAEDIKTAEYVQDIFMNDVFRVYTSTDVTGVEMGGALKNIIALCAGISDGLGFGDNTKAALMTRGLAEITRLGVAMGARAETFSGLSGVGDLIVTCTSMHSRNRRAGILLGKGKSLEETLDEVHMVVEGVNAAKAAYALSKKYGVEMPITAEANKILFEGKSPRDAVMDLMTRDKKTEHRKI
ncbi:MAG: NAD(P)H-dependent glycerol-3-phosphate dehydrogenase [Oscillospiraceae bacterium]|nr:NAD(P)H-dependent glycerol-3-phosphate dehydrogenase [Oscillospiraceae bacterium]